MKSSLTLISLLIVLTAHSQTYKKIEVTHFKGDQVSSKLIKFSSGTIQMDANNIIIDKETDKPISLEIVRKGSLEAQDEGYTAIEYICIATGKTGALKVLKVVAMYTPAKQLCDLIVKNGHQNTDYCLTDN